MSGGVGQHVLQEVQEQCTQDKRLDHATINPEQADPHSFVFQTSPGILARWIPVLPLQTCPTEVLKSWHKIKREARFMVPISICHACCVQCARVVSKSCCPPAKNAIAVGTESMMDIWQCRPTGKITRMSSASTDTLEGCYRRLNMSVGSMPVVRLSPVPRTWTLRDCLVWSVLCKLWNMSNTIFSS